MPKPFTPNVIIDKDGFPIFIEALDVEAIAGIIPTSTEGIAKINRLLATYNLDNPIDLKRAQVQYLARFNITSDSPNFKQSLADLANESNNNRVIVAQARRYAQATETINALDGNLNKTCVYVNDGANPCVNCLELNGKTMKYSEFVETNSMPADRCLGGSNCLCLLIPLD